jgi:hypothetical protein
MHEADKLIITWDLHKNPDEEERVDDVISLVGNTKKFQ